LDMVLGLGKMGANLDAQICRDGEGECTGLLLVGCRRRRE